MQSYKNWKMLNESVGATFNLGVSAPQNLGVTGQGLEEKSVEVCPVCHKKECVCSDKKMKMKNEDMAAFVDSLDLESVEFMMGLLSEKAKGYTKGCIHGDGVFTQPVKVKNTPEADDKAVVSKSSCVGNLHKGVTIKGEYPDPSKGPNNFKSPKMASESNETEEEFFASLARQFGNPYAKKPSIFDEDMLVPPTDANATVTQAQEPSPGDVGYAPQSRVGW